MGKDGKGPLAQEKIYKVMLYMTFGVASIFLIKNLVTANFLSAGVVGGCLAVFLFVNILTKKLNVSIRTQQFVLCTCLVFLVFVISIFSGAYYSDDFPLFLAVLALAGMYLEPSYTKYQTILITAIFIALYIINPKKADPLPQYIMCVVCFDVAAFIINMLIKRGRAFIEMSEMRAEEAEQLLESIKKVGDELEINYRNSASRMAGMQDANTQLERDTQGLQKGSEHINQETREAKNVCEKVHGCIQVTEQQIEKLNLEVQNVEGALSHSKNDMEQMDGQMQSVQEMVGNTETVFNELRQQIGEISQVTEHMTSIASSTKMLALNASIEAARAGEAGAGFAIVASKVQELAVDSSSCSEQVNKVVSDMEYKIAQTTSKLGESVQMIASSLSAMKELTNGFEALMAKFESLYEDIEMQNKNVSDVDVIFEALEERIQGMSVSSEENQKVVESIVNSMGAYMENMNHVVEDSKELRDLSLSMIQIDQVEKNK